MSTTDSPSSPAPDDTTAFPDWIAAFVDWVAQTALKSPAGDLGSLDAAAIIAILGVFAYIAGWWWLYNFMKNFNLHQLSLNIPKEYYVVYAYRIVQSYWYIVIPSVTITFFICYSSLAYLKGWISLPVISIVIIGGALGFFYLAECAANSFFKKMTKDFARYPKVRVYLHEESEPEIVRLYGEELSIGHFRYLFEIDDRLLLFREWKDENSENASLEVLNIRSPAVRALRFCASVGPGVDAEGGSGKPTK